MFDKEESIDIRRHRFPHCIVWTPIPCISWLIPFVGHMGICTSDGIIRDFAGSYFVSEDEMGFGWPTKYLQLPLDKLTGRSEQWDRGVAEASEEYKNHTHNLFCDNCHSHVALALNKMNYNSRSSWNMVILAAMLFFKGRYTSFCGFLKQWLPFLVIIIVIGLAVGLS